MKSLDHIPLAFPTLLSLAKAKDGATAARSWVQIARTGAFTSNRYGEFAITRDDLAQMLHNFKYVTPKAPTQLPVDWDHLSMDPKHPGDGAAAGWFHDLALREDGEELWGEVEWTPRATAAIRSKEYRFVSPSFVKNYTSKDGTKVGATLLAAAITNHPFLESMAALTLYSCAAMGDLALAATRAPAGVVHLAEVGQHVTFVDDAEKTPELTDEERSQSYVVKAVLGDGDEQVVRLVTGDGEEFGWFKVADQLAPAPPQTDQPRPKTVEDPPMQTPKTTEQQAQHFSARVSEYFTSTRNWTQAFHLAQRDDAAGALAYRLAGLSAEAVEAPSAPVLHLSARPGESFDQVAQRYAVEKGVSLRQAVHDVGIARPDLVAARG